MSLRSVAAGLALAAVFSLSFVLMWRDHNSAAPGSSPEVPAATSAGAGAAVKPVVVRDNPRPRGQGSGPPAPAVASGEYDSGTDELPVEIHFRDRPDQGRIQGSVVNASAAEMVIEAVVFSPGTGQTQTFQLLVAPYAGKPFGLDGELDLHSGDQITLKSSPYREKVARIP